MKLPVGVDASHRRIGQAERAATEPQIFTTGAKILGVPSIGAVQPHKEVPKRGTSSNDFRRRQNTSSLVHFAILVQPSAIKISASSVAKLPVIAAMRWAARSP